MVSFGYGVPNTFGGDQGESSINEKKDLGVFCPGFELGISPQRKGGDFKKKLEAPLPKDRSSLDERHNRPTPLFWKRVSKKRRGETMSLQVSEKDAKKIKCLQPKVQDAAVNTSDQRKKIQTDSQAFDAEKKKTR